MSRERSRDDTGRRRRKQQSRQLITSALSLSSSSLLSARTTINDGIRHPSSSSCGKNKQGDIHETQRTRSRRTGSNVTCYRSVNSSIVYRASLRLSVLRIHGPSNFGPSTNRTAYLCSRQRSISAFNYVSVSQIFACRVQTDHVIRRPSNQHEGS